MLKKLNSIIKGWANFHRHAVSKQSFSDVDHYTFWKIWKWACRRHPNKGRKWVKTKHFSQEGKSKWVFKIKHPEKPVTRFLASSTIIHWRPMIKMNANPYDSEWKPYFSLRHNRELTRKKPFLHESLWEKQAHRCALCNQKIVHAKEGIIYFPKDNVALDKATPLFLGRLIHTDCLESMKTGSSREDFISA